MLLTGVKSLRNKKVSFSANFDLLAGFFFVIGATIRIGCEFLFSHVRVLFLHNVPWVGIIYIKSYFCQIKLGKSGHSPISLYCGTYIYIYLSRYLSLFQHQNKMFLIIYLTLKILITHHHMNPFNKIFKILFFNHCLLLTPFFLVIYTYILSNINDIGLCYIFFFKSVLTEVCHKMPKSSAC